MGFDTAPYVSTGVRQGNESFAPVYSNIGNDDLARILQNCICILVHV